MSKFKLANLALLYLTLACVGLAIADPPVYTPPVIPTVIPPIIPPVITLPPIIIPVYTPPPQPPVQPSKVFNPLEKLPSYLSTNIGNIPVIKETSALAKNIIITKIVPSIGEIILNNTNATTPVNISGWHLKILSISHPKEELISNRSVIAPMEQFTVNVSPLSDSGIAIVSDSTEKTVDKVAYVGNWTRFS